MESPVRPERPARRRTYVRIALGGVGFLIVLAGLEIGARLFARATYRVRGYGYDAAVGFKPLPNIEKQGWWWHGTVPAKMNSKGARDAEHPYEKPPGVFRILALGDSFTYGAEVDYGERFTEYLEEELEAEVVNLGVNGYGIDQELRMLETEGLRYDPDLALVVVYFGNDFDDVSRSRISGWNKPYYDLVDGELVRQDPELTWNVRLRTASYVAEAALQQFTGVTQDSVVAACWEDRDTTPVLVALLEEMDRVARHNGFPLLIVLTYPLERMAEPPWENEVRTRAGLERAGLNVLDTYLLFEGRADERPRYYQPGLHWTPLGHAMIAEAIGERIRTEGWVPDPDAASTQGDR